MGGWNDIPFWVYVVFAPVAWPELIAMPFTYDMRAEHIKAALAGLSVAALEIALAWWLAGGNRVRLAVYAGAMLFLPMLVASMWRNSGSGDIIPMYIKDSEGRFIEVDGVPDGVDGYVKENGRFVLVPRN